MKSDGIVKYENYKGRSARGLKNNRVKKREILRSIIREEKREAYKRDQNAKYKKVSEYEDFR